MIVSGLNVTEVGHDMQAKYVTHTLKVVNSYDTWHGMLDIIGCMHHYHII